MTKARLKLAGADMSKVGYLSVTEDLDKQDTFERDVNLKNDIEILRKHVREDEIKAIYLDPANSYLGIDEEKDGYTGIRRALERLNLFAQKEEILIRAMKHTKKPNGEVLPMVSMVYGSKAWTEVIRIFPILWPVSDKTREQFDLDVDDPTNVVLLRGKNNYAPKSLPAQGLCIDSDHVMLGDDLFEDVTYMTFTKLQRITNDELEEKLAETKKETKARQGEENKTDVWLENFLKSRGKVPRRDVMEAFNKEGIATEKTLKTRARKMGIVSEPMSGGNNRAVYWSLPLEF